MRKSTKTQYVLMVIFAIVLIVIDQLSKFLIVSYIPLQGAVNAIPGLFHWTYYQNTGAAFSLLQGNGWLFIVIVVILLAGIVWEFKKQYLPLTILERFCIVAIAAGGVSNNLIDRLYFGYVIDMIQLEFMNFAIFNLADCFVTCGCVVLMIHIIFFNKEFWKEEK